MIGPVESCKSGRVFVSSFVTERTDVQGTYYGVGRRVASGEARLFAATPFSTYDRSDGSRADLSGWDGWVLPFPSTSNSLTNSFANVVGSNSATVTLKAVTATSNVTGRSRLVITNSNQSAGFTEASLYDGFAFPGNAGTLQVAMSGGGVVASNTVYQVTVIANDTSGGGTTVFFENAAGGFVLGTQAASTITMPGNPHNLVNSDSRAQLTFNLTSNSPAF